MLTIAEFFVRYPQYLTLRALVPDDVIARELVPRVDDYERWYADAKLRIPQARLCDVLPAEAELGQITLQNFLGHWGNTSVEEVAKLALIVKYLHPRRILEIGTYNGMTALQMALNAPAGCTTYTLDLPDDVASQLQLSELDRLCSIHFRQRLGTSTGSYFAGRTDVNVVQLLGNSANFDYAAAIDGPVDLVFIDAAHDYANKKCDSENALRLLSDRGMILWHNYADVGSPEVTQYLADLSRTLPIKHLKNTYLAVYNRGMAT